MFRPYFVDLDLAVKSVKDSASQFLCDSGAYGCEHFFSVLRVELPCREYGRSRALSAQILVG